MHSAFVNAVLNTRDSFNLELAILPEANLLKYILVKAKGIAGIVPATVGTK